MPSGYTAPILEGQSFRDYVLNCARAFGALASIRDEDSDDPIPTKFELSSYYADRVAETEKKIKRLEVMTDEEALTAAIEEQERRKTSARESLNRVAESKAKYDAMLAQVQAWEPPTDDHQELKKFMITQIEESIDYDCDTQYEEAVLKQPAPTSGSEWLKDHLNWAKVDLDLYQSNVEREVNQASDNTSWIQSLMESL